jgi:signal transduction histidine kinase/CheY-like chemotaxis protein
MRRKMSEALAQKQQMMATAQVNSAKEKAKERDMPDLMSTLSQVESSSDESVATGTMSTDSARTVRASANVTPGTVRTPSYPFPRMQMMLNRGSSHRSAPSHKPFTLLSPTSDPPSNYGSFPRADLISSDMDTPTGQASTISQIYRDPNYPMPDLYETILCLNAEPGLDMWWSNVCDILNEAYGAERASLALPGDITDLENVPWGQKATFNQAGSDSSGLSNLDSLGTSEVDFTTSGLGRGQASTTTTSPATRRPALESRHSIAGPLPEMTNRQRPRPTAPLRANSSMPGQTSQQTSATAPRLTRQAPTPRTQSSVGLEPASSVPTDLASIDGPAKCYVFKNLQPLEQEADPLLVRTGVSTLFGKRRPVVLTRTYSDEATPSSSRLRPSEDARSEAASLTNAKARSKASDRSDSVATVQKAVDEYEQPEPSPWSQSPSPSPAARPDPTESPFFNQSTSIDETAFAKDPPQYDYSAEANQSLSAIGADGAKSLIHVPLIQPVNARGSMASTLRFPIAILSFSSPLNPYPLALRHSIAYLLPHLASSFSIAQQYSNLQDRLRGGAVRGHGAAFGLGGTFSDEGSELELVAELSGQVAQEKERAASGTKSEDTFSLADRSLLRESPASSLANTPIHEHVGLTPGMPPTPGRSGADMVEGYFSAKRHRGSKATTPGGRRQAEEKSNTNESKPEKPSKTARKETAPLKPPAESSAPVSPRPGSQTSESEFGDVAGALERLEHGMRKSSQARSSTLSQGGEKPLPELISSLMLNAVPLQLFLAKPGSGDLVWTNRKFDAFRSQGEGRVRDPWKNVHHDDRGGLSKLWGEALNSGSQFTHYIRVKRFNSDSDFRWFVFRASTLLSHNGRLLYWIGSFLDVHEQYIKNLEASEREASMARDAKIRAMADAIPQVLFEAIEGEGIVAVNQQWHTYSGQNLEDARGLGFARHVHREDLHKCGILSPTDAAAISRATAETDSSSSDSSNRTIGQQPIKKSLFAPDAGSLATMLKQSSVTEEQDENGRLSYLTEIRLRSKGGEYRWFLVRLVRVDSSFLSSGLASWYGTCTDIEIRKALERELNNANQKVHSEMESKTKFFANMSHEIRTPLNGILGSMPWLTESPLDTDQRRTVDTIQNSANNLRELVDNILDVTKVEAGKMNLIPKFFHVRTLCEEVIDTVSSRAIERGLELNYSLDVTVPATVKGDPFRVRQILLNLLGNSVKFTEQGEVYMNCTAREDTKAASTGPRTILLSFSVVDTGRGFNVNDFQRLFKQFGQIGSGSNSDAGSGLGLFLSKQLVEMHGGELTVQSQSGEGSTFSFYIRVELPGPGDEPTSPPPSSRAIRHRQSSSMGSRSQSETKTPTVALNKVPVAPSAVIQTPGLSRYITSPEVQSPDVFPSAIGSPPTISPPVTSTASTQASMRSDSIGQLPTTSPASSLVPTPESQRGKSEKETKNAPQRHESSSRQLLSEQALAMHPALRRTKSDNDPASIAVEQAHPATYSIVVVCPAEYARNAIRQHIEHVVPLQIPTNVTTVADIGQFVELFQGPTSPKFTHVVLDIPASSDVMLFMRQLESLTGQSSPSLIIVTDHYQKRDIQEDFQAMTASGRKAFMIHKPVKPSVFAMIFDPAQLRNLSKDRAREIAQNSNDDFRKTAMGVKDAIGNKGHRVLLVEDSDVNRKVIWKYLQKVGLQNEEARDGQECVNHVFAHPPGHYSLIICDIQMPNKNGYEACMEIRAWEREKSLRPIPIMALTANAMPEERAAAAAAGFTDYLTKPVEYNVLGHMMVTLLREGGEHVFLRDRPLGA